jgi:hypothetical protein
VYLVHHDGTARSHPGVVHFVVGTSLTATTLTIASRVGVWLGPPPKRADGTAKSAVRYQLTASADAMCARWGGPGTDTDVWLLDRHAVRRRIRSPAHATDRSDRVRRYGVPGLSPMSLLRR